MDEPYWAVINEMLSGTIKSEMEDMLQGDERLAMNRASVAICRKVQRMPHVDIEQAGLAAKAIERTGRFAARSENRSA